MEFSSEKPTKSALYYVDRGAQGKYYRYYNAETDTWSLCGSDFAEAVANMDKPSPVGFFPWVGPMTGPNFKGQVVTVKTEEGNEVVVDGKSKKPALLPTKKKPAKAAVGKLSPVPVPKYPSKVVHPDGTVFYREDRQKWVAVVGGRQEAARPTAEACLNFLMKKYGITGVVLNKE
jgi:regulator of RNase E activity RraA